VISGEKGGKRGENGGNRGIFREKRKKNRSAAKIPTGELLGILNPGKEVEAIYLGVYLGVAEGEDGLGTFNLTFVICRTRIQKLFCPGEV
jgi:hypothetical protein